jgi:hypothetical protein
MSDDFDQPGYWRRRVVLFLLTILVLMPLIFAGWTWVTLNYSYSTGERAGFIQKISKKGWVCKTWEGELAMANLPGTMPQIFEFSVRDEAIAKQLSSMAGQRVAINYEQHRGIPTSCFGETQYFITKVTPVTDTSLTPTLSVGREPVPPTQ